MIRWVVFDIGGVLVYQGKINTKLLEYCYQLKGRGISLGIISNFTASHASRFELDKKLFFPEVYADTLGIRKPDIQVFDYFCYLAECRPNECVFVDDNLFNVNSAGLFGMHSIQYQDLEIFKKQMEQYL